MEPNLPSVRIVDLVPRRMLTLVGLWVAGASLIALLEVLYFWMLRWAPTTTDGRIAAFDLDGEGSLGAWYSSTLLMLAALATWLVYWLRSARQDDYQARYRVWLWAGAGWLVMGIDEAASLHEGFKELVVHTSGMRIVGDGSIWWIAAYLLVLLPIGLRLILDMRGSRLALSALAAGAGCYVLALVAQLEWIPGLSVTTSILIEEGAEMTGNLWLLWAMLTHARYLLLGNAPPEAARPRRRARQAVSAVTEVEESDSTPSVPTAPARIAATSRPPTTGTANATSGPSATIRRVDSAAAAAASSQRLSKSERKAMRRNSRDESDDWE